MAPSRTLIILLVAVSAFITMVSAIAYNTYNATELPDTIQPEVIEQYANSSSQPGSNGTRPGPSGGVVVKEGGILDVDIGFLNSIKYIYSEEYINGYIVNVSRVGINDYCSGCAIVFTVEGGDGRVYHVLVYGRWYLIERYEGEEEHGEHMTRVLSIDDMEGYLIGFMDNGTPVKVEVVVSNLYYGDSRLYIGYEIKPHGMDIELVSAVITEPGEHD